MFISVLVNTASVLILFQQTLYIYIYIYIYIYNDAISIRMFESELKLCYQNDCFSLPQTMSQLRCDVRSIFSGRDHYIHGWTAMDRVKNCLALPVFPSLWVEGLRPQAINQSCTFRLVANTKRWSQVLQYRTRQNQRLHHYLLDLAVTCKMWHVKFFGRSL